MELFARENYLKKIRNFYHTDDLIKVITGVHRCGKSCLMQLVAEELREAGVPEKNIIYIDLDKRGYRNIKTASELETLIAVHGDRPGLKYLFIDEVQNVYDFEIVLNGFRNEGGWSIFITGSNSYVLSGELITKLTGRYIEFELFPLSFEEYEEMKRFYEKSILPNPTAELNQYILEGGFPRTIFFDGMEDKRRYVQGVIKEIIDKDIRKRIKIRKKETFERVGKYIINNFGTMISLNRLTEELRQSDIIVAPQTVSRYVKALIDAKILYECPRFDLKSRRSMSGEQKYYLADLSFYFIENADNRGHFEPILENLVYIYARSLDYTVNVGKKGKVECDFIIRSLDMDYAYIQVAHTIAGNQEREDREYRPFELIPDNYPKYLMTMDSLLQKRNGIHHVNIVDFMMANQHFD